ncbi:MAG: trehalose-phosphatase [Actinomycetota bacterium]
MSAAAPGARQPEPTDIDDTLLTSLAVTPRLLVASDFDGVLSPIVDDPMRSFPIAASIEALARLAEHPETDVAIVSGRERSRLQLLVPQPERFTLVGSHGAELDGIEVDEQDRLRLQRLTDDLGALGERFDGFFVEAKALSVAAHFRRVAPDRRNDAVEAVDALIDGWPAKVLTGKEVVEFTIGTADKGDAVVALRDRTEATVTVYLGDDVTDEDAFAALDPGDIGIKIGPGPTAATHRLDAPAAVTTFLADLADRRCRS